MATRNTTRTALRASLKQEDEALGERLPAAATGKTPPRSRKPAAPAKSSTSSAAATSKPAAPGAKPATRKPAAATKPPAKAAAAKTTAATRSPAARSNPAAAGKKPAARTTTASATVAPTPAVKQGKARAVAPAPEKPKSAATKVKREKIERDSFSMPMSEHKRIRKLREALDKAGRSATKSEVIRAGFALLASRSAAEIIVLLDALPRVTKGKSAKKR